MTVYEFTGIPVGAAVTVHQRPDGVRYSTPTGTAVASGTADGAGTYTTPDLPDSDDYTASWPAGDRVAWRSPVTAPPPPDASTAAAIAAQHTADAAAFAAKPTAAASPGVAAGADAAVVNAVVAILREAGFCA